MSGNKEKTIGARGKSKWGGDLDFLMIRFHDNILIICNSNTFGLNLVSYNSVHSVAYAIRGGLMMGYATKPINAILRGGQSLRLKSHPMARVDISPPSPTPNHIRRVLGKIHLALCADSQWLIICAKLLIALGTL